MSGRMLVRLAAVVAIAAAGAGLVRWWNSPERRIGALLADVAGALTYDAPGSGLGAIASAAVLQPLLAPDVVVDVNPPSPPLRGRQDVVATAARVRAAGSMMRVQFFDADIRVLDPVSAAVRVTAQVTTRDEAGAELAEARQIALALVEEGGQWMVAGAHLVPETSR